MTYRDPVTKPRGQRSHEQRLAKKQVQEMRARYGAGWDLLGETAQRGLVALELVSVLSARTGPREDRPDLDGLWEFWSQALYDAGL